MPLDDLAIERYSRQLVLPEIGPDGQARLAAARVAIAARGVAAERVVAYLAAAGVGTLALPPELRPLVDAGQPDVRVEALAADPRTLFDAALVDTALDDAPARHGATGGDVRARHSFWIAGGRAAEIPPCSACAVRVLGASAAITAPLVTLRETLLGTVIATEIAKAIVAIGTPLRGHVLTYDPAGASLTRQPIAAPTECPRCHPSRTV